MGELAGTFIDSPEAKIASDRDQAVELPKGEDGQPEGVPTDVDGVYADAVNKRDNLPIFKVSKDEFFQNMNYGRKRLRFKTGTKAQQYMRKSKYQQPFWIQDDDSGHIRKIAK